MINTESKEFNIKEIREKEAKIENKSLNIEKLFLKPTSVSLKPENAKPSVVAEGYVIKKDTDWEESAYESTNTIILADGPYLYKQKG